MPLTAAESAPEVLSPEDIHEIISGSFPQVYRALSGASPAVRAKWAKQIDEMPASSRRNAIVSAFYKTFVQIDPRGAAQAIADSHDRIVRQVGIAALVGAAPTTAMKELAAVLVDLPRDLARPPRRDLDDVIWEWSSVDPVAVATFFDENTNKYLSGHFDSLIRNWAEVDPQAAKEWLHRQPAKDQQNERTIDNLVFGWLENDRNAAMDFVIANATEKSFLETIRDLSFSLFLDSPDAASAFIQRLPTTELQHQAIGEAVTMTATGVILGALPEWERSPDDVMKWVLGFPDEMRTELGPLAAAWRRKDAAGFDAWLAQQPIQTRDQIMADYCMNAQLDTNEYMISVAMGITDPALREQSLRALVKSLGSDKQKITEKLSELNIPSGQKKHLTQLIPNG